MRSRSARSAVTALLAVVAGCGNPGALPTPDSSAEPSAAVTAGAPPPAAPEPPQAPPPPPPPSPKVLALLPLGGVAASDVGIASASISHYFGWIVRVLPAEDMPAQAWYAKRKRHRAEKILDWLRPRLPEGADRIMALTELDISTAKPPHADWGICGLADIGAAASVVSTFRIRKKMGGATGEARAARYEQRLRDLAAHEFGHQLGLDHCPTRGCLMEDAMGTVSTFDRSSGELCPTCRTALVASGYALP
jgi:archaemetzincin